MSVNEIKLLGNNAETFDNKNKKVEKDSECENIFSFTFKPESFGGKTSENFMSTSVFDIWDS